MTLDPHHQGFLTMTPTGNSSDKNEWRIQPISFHDPNAMMETNWGALLGALLFVVGIVGSLKAGALVLVAVFGLLFALLSLLFRARTVRKNWQKLRHIAPTRNGKKCSARQAPKAASE